MTIDQPLRTRTYAPFLIALILGASWAGCLSNAGSSGPCGSGSFTVTDDRGHATCFEQAPKRIASLSPSTTEIACALGLCANLVAVDKNSDYPPEVNAIQTRLETFGAFNREALKAARPDVVLAASANKEYWDVVEKELGIKLIVLLPKNLSDVYGNIELMGRLGGSEAQAKALVANLSQREKTVVDRVKGASTQPRVYHELDSSLYSVGPGSFIDSLLTEVHAKNIASAATAQYPQLSPEDVIASDPEIITCSQNSYYTCDKAEIASRPGWGNITAVRTGHIVNLPSDLIDRPGPRLVDGLELFARTLHPEMFT